jgi:hypothetical protein
VDAGLSRTQDRTPYYHLKPENAAHALGNARKALAEIQRGLMKPTAHGLSEGQVLFGTLAWSQPDKQGNNRNRFVAVVGLTGWKAVEHQGRIRP